MSITTLSRSKLLRGLAILLLASVVLIRFENPLQAEESSLAEAESISRLSMTEALAGFLTIPFREDGAQDQLGRWVTFNEPETISKDPGFNCSGFTVAAARALLGYNFSLAEASYDRRGDSGLESGWGQDWDFGLDLILNLSEGYPRRFLPEPQYSDQAARIPFQNDRSLGWGVSIHSREFEEQLSLIRPGRFCFFVFSRPDRRFPAGVSYYHVGVIVPEGDKLWLYHSTAGAKTHRVDLADPKGLDRIRRHFKPIAVGERRVFMVEVDPRP